MTDALAARDLSGRAGGARAAVRRIALLATAAIAVGGCGSVADPTLDRDASAGDGADGADGTASDAAAQQGRRVVVRPLGTFTIAAGAVASDTVDFEVAPGATAAALVASTGAEVSLAFATMELGTLDAASSPVNWPETAPNTVRTCWTCASAAHLDPGAATWLIPSSELAASANRGSAQVIARTWDADLAEFDVPTEPIDVVVALVEIYDRGERSPLLLDVTPYVGGSGSAQAFDVWRESADSALGVAGIALAGSVTSTAATLVVRVDGDGRMAVEGVPSATDPSADAIRLFLADELFDASGEPVLAVSSALPSSWPASDPAAAAVAINVPLADELGVDVGVLMAHELAHQLGLQHVVERGAGAGVVGQDRIADTAATDSDNLMFWESRVGGTRLTPGQVVALRAHPRLRSP